MKFLITGGAGFIGSNVISYLINETDHNVLNLDKLTYAGNLKSINITSSHRHYQFIKGDINDNKLVKRIFLDFQPDIVMHLAAESHVDRSIDGPTQFIKTNIVGTSSLLECALEYWNNVSENQKKKFRFHHISTDEVFGSLGEKGLFTEKNAYNPSSPYAASKASSDHLVRAWHRTYGLPALITNCSNNYGPYQFPEKLIPLIILNAIEGKKLPIYGDGLHVRDWLFVEDHVKALLEVVSNGQVGETYNVGGHSEKTNLEVVNVICSFLDEIITNEKPNGISSFKDLITFVPDRPGHDRRYAIDSKKITNELNWRPSVTFEKGIEKTIKWYLENTQWSRDTLNSGYKRNRLGILKNQ